MGQVGLGRRCGHCHRFATPSLTGLKNRGRGGAHCTAQRREDNSNPAFLLHDFFVIICVQFCAANVSVANRERSALHSM
jgi:hypothetical protein